MGKKLTILLLLFFVLCGFRYTGKLTEYPVDRKNTEKFFRTKFAGQKRMSIINAQPSTMKFLIARKVQGSEFIITTDLDESLATADMLMEGPGMEDNIQELVGNLNSWTETAICLLKAALEKKGFTISSEADRSLKISISPKFDMIPYPLLSRCIVYLEVKAGNGYTQEYEGDNISYDSFENIFGGSIKLTVEELLNDDNILTYLGAPKKWDSATPRATSALRQNKGSRNDRKAWTVPEVAEAFGVPETTIRRWVIDGELTATKVGSTWLIPDSEVERISNPKEKTSKKRLALPNKKKSYEEDPLGWLKKLRHLKAIGLLSKEEYLREEQKLRDEGLI